MAYAYTYGVTTATQPEVFTVIRSVLVSAGWIEYDIQSTYTVFRSDGETPDGKYMYFKVYNNSYQHLYICNWSTTSHTYTGGSLGLYTLNTVNSTVQTSCYADKSGIWICQAQSGVLSSSILVVKSTPDFTVETTVSSPISTGTNVVITVANNADFIVGASYAIYDVANGKKQAFICTAKGTGTVTASSIDTTLATGSLIGVNVFPVIVYSSTNITTPQPVISHSPSQTGGVVGSMIQYTAKLSRASDGYNTSSAMYLHIDGLDLGAGKLPTKHRFLNLEIIEGSISVAPYFLHKIGTYSTFKMLPKLATTSMFLVPDYQNFDVDAIGINVTGTSTGENSPSTLTDTTKSWTVNQWANKVLVITSGPTAGQVVKIISNTATSLTVNTMSVIPSLDNYIICDEAYRIINSGSGAWILLKEGI